MKDPSGALSQPQHWDCDWRGNKIHSHLHLQSRVANWCTRLSWKQVYFCVLLPSTSAIKRLEFQSRLSSHTGKKTHFILTELRLQEQHSAFYQTTVLWEAVDKRVRRQNWGPAGRCIQVLFVMWLYGLWLKLRKKKLPLFQLTGLCWT